MTRLNCYQLVCIGPLISHDRSRTSLSETSLFICDFLRCVLLILSICVVLHYWSQWCDTVIESHSHSHTPISLSLHHHFDHDQACQQLDIQDTESITTLAIKTMVGPITINIDTAGVLVHMHHKVRTWSSLTLLLLTPLTSLSRISHHNSTHTITTTNREYHFHSLTPT